MKQNQRVDFTSLRLVAQLPWEKATGDVRLKSRSNLSKERIAQNNNPRDVFEGKLSRFETLGCNASFLRKLLHIATIAPKPKPYPTKKAIGAMANKMARLAEEMKKLEDTGFIRLDDIEHDPEQCVFLSRKEAIAHRKQQLPYRLKRRAKEYKLWLSKNSALRIDQFERVPYLIVGIYIQWATFKSRISEVVDLLNRLEEVKVTLNIDTYRREIKRFMKECPRSHAYLQSLFKLYCP